MTTDVVLHYRGGCGSDFLYLGRDVGEVGLQLEFVQGRVPLECMLGGPRWVRDR